jgi:hypothetical protein
VLTPTTVTANPAFLAQEHRLVGGLRGDDRVGGRVSVAGGALVTTPTTLLTITL